MGPFTHVFVPVDEVIGGVADFGEGIFVVVDCRLGAGAGAEWRPDREELRTDSGVLLSRFGSSTF